MKNGGESVSTIAWFQKQGTLTKNRRGCEILLHTLNGESWAVNIRSQSNREILNFKDRLKWIERLASEYITVNNLSVFCYGFLGGFSQQFYNILLCLAFIFYVIPLWATRWWHTIILHFKFERKTGSRPILAPHILLSPTFYSRVFNIKSSVILLFTPTECNCCHFLL